MDMTSDTQRWRMCQYVVAAGAVLFLAGLIGIQTNGGLGEAQWPASTADFNAYVGANLDDVRAANLADMVLFVPGYLLLALGVAQWISVLPGGQARVGSLAKVAFVLVAVAAVTDTIENVVLRMGANDLPASGDLVSTMKAFGVVKYATFAVGFALLFGVAVWRWRRHRGAGPLGPPEGA